MKWWKKLDAQSRLMLLFALLALVGAVNAVVGINNAVGFNEQLFELQAYLDSYQRNATAQSSLLKAQTAIQDYISDPSGSVQDRAAFRAQVYQAQGQLSDYLDAQWVNLDLGEDADPDEVAEARQVLNLLDSYIEAFIQQGDAVLESEVANLDGMDAAATQLEYQLAALSNGDLKDIQEQISWIETSVQFSATLGRIALLLLVALILWGVYLVNDISRPLAGLTSAIVAFQNNTFKPEMLEAYTNRRDELGQLARAVSAMATSITEANRIKEVFINSASRFIPTEYLDFLEKPDITQVDLGDNVAAEMAVMFSDIRGFTSLSERMSAQENFDFVNEYLKLISPVIQDHEGFIVKFLGDGMMAIFPYGVEDAVQAGVEKQEKVKEFNALLQARNLPTVSVGIGIHTGQMMVGMIGEEDRLQGDAFSDNVNLTSRIEGLNKFYGTSMIISEDTLAQLQNPKAYKMRYLGKAVVKGRLTPLGLYEIYQGLPQEEVALKEATQVDFERGVQLFSQGEFLQAQRSFDAVLEVNPNDRTARDFLERSAEWMERTLPVDWDGSIVMDAK